MSKLMKPVELYIKKYLKTEKAWRDMPEQARLSWNKLDHTRAS